MVAYMYECIYEQFYYEAKSALIGKKNVGISKISESSNEYPNFLFWFRNVLLRIKDGFSKWLLFSFEAMFFMEGQMLLQN